MVLKPTKLLHYDIDLTPYLDEDYKNTSFYETFRSYINEQRADGNFIFYGESVITVEDICRTHVIRLHVQNLKIDEEMTEIVYNFNGSDNRLAPKKYIYNNETQTIDMDFDYPFLQRINSYRLIMKFVGSITSGTESFVNTSNINDKEEKR